MVRRRGDAPGGRGENLRRSIWLQSSIRGAIWCADLRMEKQRYFAAAHPRRFHMETLPRQNHSDPASHVGGLDSADGDYLLPAACSAISSIRTGAHFFGVAPHLHDESVWRKN